MDLTKKLGIPDKILSVVIHRKFLSSPMVNVLIYLPEQMDQNNDVMAPALFALYFSILLDFIFGNSNTTSDFVLQMGYLIISGLKIKP